MYNTHIENEWISDEGIMRKYTELNCSEIKEEKSNRRESNKLRLLKSRSISSHRNFHFILSLKLYFILWYYVFLNFVVFQFIDCCH